jgi:hypothetical protein
MIGRVRPIWSRFAVAVRTGGAFSRGDGSRRLVSDHRGALRQEGTLGRRVEWFLLSGFRYDCLYRIGECLAALPSTGDTGTLSDPCEK